jgi:hypothetical protein
MLGGKRSSKGNPEMRHGPHVSAAVDDSQPGPSLGRRRRDCVLHMSCSSHREPDVLGQSSVRCGDALQALSHAACTRSITQSVHSAQCRLRSPRENGRRIVGLASHSRRALHPRLSQARTLPYTLTLEATGRTAGPLRAEQPVGDIDGTIWEPVAEEAELCGSWGTGAGESVSLATFVLMTVLPIGMAAGRMRPLLASGMKGGAPLRSTSVISQGARAIARGFQPAEAGAEDHHAERPRPVLLLRHGVPPGWHQGGNYRAGLALPRLAGPFRPPSGDAAPPARVTPATAASGGDDERHRIPCRPA